MSKFYYYCKQILFYLCLSVYIFILAKALLFKQVSLFEFFNTNRVISRTLNIIPFKTIFEYSNIWVGLMNVVGNIILFIPLGLYLQIFKKNKKILNSVAITCLISLCVEVMQYILGIGHTDIDDIILNTFGGLLGVGVYRIIYLLLKDDSKTKTAITYLFLIIGICCGGCFFIIVKLLGYRVKIL